MTATLRRVGRHREGWTAAAWRALGVGLVLLFLGVVGGASLERAPTVQQVRLVNRAEFDIQLFVAPVDDSSLWLRLPVAPHDSERAIEEVIDPGGEWNVQARGQGLDGGTWVVRRADLEADGWRLEIPDEVIRRLRDSGAAPTPP
jgi:hypothetical protein